MRPLTSSAVTTAFLKDKQFLLLNASVFDTRYVGSLLTKDAIKSEGGIALPPEIWLKIFKLLTKKPEYHLARVLTATSRGESTTLSCEVDLSALTSPLAYLDNAHEVRAMESYLAAPDQQHGLSFLGIDPGSSYRPSPTSRFFSISVTDSDNYFLPHCLFYENHSP